MALDAHEPGVTADLSHGFGEFEAFHFLKGKAGEEGIASAKRALGSGALSV